MSPARCRLLSKLREPVRGRQNQQTASGYQYYTQEMILPSALKVKYPPRRGTIVFKMFITLFQNGGFPPAILIIINIWKVRRPVVYSGESPHAMLDNRFVWEAGRGCFVEKRLSGTRTRQGAFCRQRKKAMREVKTRFSGSAWLLRAPVTGRVRPPFRSFPCVPHRWRRNSSYRLHRLQSRGSRCPPGTGRL